MIENNAFSATRLGELVPTDAEIVVVGMQSDFCVRATCSAALGRGNQVLLIRGAHATYDRHEFWIGGGVTKPMTPAKDIEADIEAELEEAGVVVLDMKDIPGVFADDR
jgi:Isochorismatase family